MGVAITRGWHRISAAAIYSYGRSHQMESVIRGHHVYKHVWTPFEGEELVLEQEHHNSYDHYATKVMKDGVTVGRAPRELSRLFWNFIASGGVITCEVTGRRKKGKGLEVPCIYNLRGTKKLVSKFKAKKMLCTTRHSNSCPY